MLSIFSCVHVGHLYLFFGKMSIQVLCQFFNRIVFLSCMSSLYILDIDPLSDASFANIFSYSVGCFLFVGSLFCCVDFLPHLELKSVGSNKLYYQLFISRLDWVLGFIITITLLHKHSISYLKITDYQLSFY